jgi:uncharacterized protein (DUF1330 family)
MNRHIALGLAMVAGAALGAAAVQGLQAQAKPPIYLVTEIDAPNMEAYVKEYAPLAQKSIQDAGGRIVGAGPAKTVEGEPPKARVTVQIWDSPEKMMAWRATRPITRRPARSATSSPSSARSTSKVRPTDDE